MKKLTSLRVLLAVLILGAVVAVFFLFRKNNPQSPPVDQTYTLFGGTVQVSPFQAKVEDVLEENGVLSVQVGYVDQFGKKRSERVLLSGTFDLLSIDPLPLVSKSDAFVRPKTLEEYKRFLKKGDQIQVDYIGSVQSLQQKDILLECQHGTRLCNLLQYASTFSSSNDWVQYRQGVSRIIPALSIRLSR